MTDPLPFQIEGVKRIHAFKDRALLADEMGCGKTFSAILAAVESKAFPLLIICPKSLKLHWKRQCWKHFGLKSKTLSSMSPYGTRLLRKHKILIINYDILGPWVNFLRSMKFKMIVYDESHMIGSLKTQRTKNCIYLARDVEKIIAISGTPLTNRPFELFPVLHILLPRRFSNPYSFGHRFCDADQVFGVWRFQGAKNLDKLHSILTRRCMIRRTKKEVAKDLPPICWSVVPVEIQNRKEYIHAEKDLIGWLAKTDPDKAHRAAQAERFTRFTYLKALAAELKMQAVMECIDAILAESDEKILLGVIHKRTTKLLYERYGQLAEIIDGSKTEKQRERAERRFKKEADVRILIGQIKVCGVGLNLPEAGVVGFVELPFTPGACQQFAARAHRLNSVNPVQVIYWISENTIEEKLCKIIQKKSRVLDKILEGKVVKAATLSILDELHKQMIRKKR